MRRGEYDGMHGPEPGALAALLLLLAAIAVLSACHGCSVMKTPVGESWNFFYDSGTEIEAELTMPDGTKAKVKYRRAISPDNEAIRSMAAGLAEGAVKGAVGGER